MTEKPHSENAKKENKAKKIEILSPEDEITEIEDINIEDEGIQDAEPLPFEAELIDTDPLELKEEEIRELKNELLRVRADSENFKKRLQKEKTDSVQFANEGLIKSLLPIYDNLERALNSSATNVDSLKEGVQMIAKQFLGFLDKENVKPIEALGKAFDPAYHEVLSKIESSEHEENVVIEEYMKGYTLKQRVLIPAKVVIAKAPVKKETPSDEKDENKEMQS